PERELKLLKMMMNPDVTVRMRGVMEKCTFCVQRIEQARIANKIAKTSSGDSGNGMLPMTACQQACPAGAIVFGDMKNPQSPVSQLGSNPRAYRLLEHLNLQQRVIYLFRVINPNPDMPDGGRRPAGSAPAGAGSTLAVGAS
ncbi:MAG: hydrogenase, partial [Verrucomicrobiae bacterium]|nr:hydrogenase [Verrucomicrobiae bacterium]